MPQMSPMWWILFPYIVLLILVVSYGILYEMAIVSEDFSSGFSKLKLSGW